MNAASILECIHSRDIEVGSLVHPRPEVGMWGWLFPAACHELCSKCMQDPRTPRHQQSFACAQPELLGPSLAPMSSTAWRLELSYMRRPEESCLAPLQCACQCCC